MITIISRKSRTSCFLKPIAISILSKTPAPFFFGMLTSPGVLCLVSSGGKEMFHSPPGCRVAFHFVFYGFGGLRPKMLPLKPVRVKFQGSVGLFTMIPMRFLWSEWQAKVSYRELQHQKADLEKVCLHHLFLSREIFMNPIAQPGGQQPAVTWRRFQGSDYDWYFSRCSSLYSRPLALRLLYTCL